MKKYVKADVKIIQFVSEDIITVSGTAAAMPDIYGQSVGFKSAWIENNGSGQSEDLFNY